VKLRILCPGLLGPLDPPPGPPPDTPALDRLLARADDVASASRDPLETLAAAFGVTAAPARDLPSAALCLLAEAPDLAGAGYWYHADPVHLRADRDRLMLFAGPTLAVREDEARSLVCAFNDHFEADGLSLVAPVPQRWYLRVQGDAPDLCTSPLHRVQGRSVDPYLPTGPDASAWVRWQNEAQMLFFQHPANQARAAAGRPTLGGVWTWGGGGLSAVASAPAAVVGDHPLAVGLALAAGCRRLALADLAGGIGDLVKTADRSRSVLVFWDCLRWPASDGDWDGWRRALAALETLAASLRCDLESGRLDALVIEDGGALGCAVSRGALRCFWRSRGGLGERMARARDAQCP
jgi:hypothetical protein